MQSQIYSFDVFDTCISRRFAYPRDLFFELGLRLAPANLSTDKKNAFARNFQSLRIRAEKRASSLARPHRCVDIFEIYREFQPPAGTSVVSERIAELEIALERENIYAIPEILEKIGQLRRSGAKIIFISDMYLPKSILGPMLQGVGILQLGDPLYVSCDVRLSKHSGKLFEHVLRTEAIRTDDIVHFGDNHQADIQMAMRSGISAEHFTAASLNEHERRISERAIALAHGTSQIAALSRMSRLTLTKGNKSSSHPLDNLIHSTIAPFLASYVAWVIDHARSSKIKRLYFAARDGQILYRMASQLLGADGNLEIRYLYGSRRAWLSPSITRDTNIWHRLLVTGGMSNSYFDILSRTGLQTDAQLAVFAHFDIPEAKRNQKLNQEQAISFVQRVFADGVASELILDSASKARQVALKYLEQEGLLEDKSWALVDVGWALNCQAALRRIISTVKGNNFQTIGYYIDLDRDHLSPEHAGIAHTYMRDRNTLFFRRRAIVEHCFTPAIHPTTRGYAIQGNTAVPLFGSETRNATELEYAGRLQTIAEHYARLLREDKAIKEQFILYKQTIIKTVETFISNPPLREAKYLSTFGTIADLRHEGPFIQRLCEPMGLYDLLSIVLMTFSKKFVFKARAIMWLEGSMVLSPAYVRIPIRGMLWLDCALKKMRMRKQHYKTPDQASLDTVVPLSKARESSRLLP